jgi:hypothetical protein
MHQANKTPPEPVTASLPPELYRPIVSPIDDRRTLAALMCVSQVFNGEAERILYRTVEYDKERRRWPLLYGPQLPRVAAYVRCISFIGVHIELEVNGFFQEPIEADAQAESVFSQLKNVETFITDRSWPMTTHNIHFTSKLTTFRTEADAFRSMYNFMRIQDQITELDWLADGWSSSFDETTPGLLPLLDIFTFNDMSAILLGQRKKLPRRLRYRCWGSLDEEAFSPSHDVQVLHITAPPDADSFAVNDHVMIPPFTILTPSIQYFALRSEWVCRLC